MKVSILNFGKVLNITEQKNILGGHNTEAQIACRRCIPGWYFDTCDMELACNLEEASVMD